MDNDKVKLFGCLLIITIGVGFGIYSVYIYFSTPIEGKVQERGREVLSYYFTIGEDTYYCTKDQYNQICIGSVVRFIPSLYLVRDFEVISSVCS